MSARRVWPMLRAMATECLLKGLFVKYGGKLAENGEYIHVLKREHQLGELAKKVAKQGPITFTEREIAVLEFVSFWIASGRYPIQKGFTHMVPYERSDGTVAPKQF